MVLVEIRIPRRSPIPLILWDLIPRLYNAGTNAPKLAVGSKTGGERPGPLYKDRSVPAVQWIS
jgi:hypothetical protein